MKFLGLWTVKASGIVFASWRLDGDKEKPFVNRWLYRSASGGFQWRLPMNPDNKHPCEWAYPMADKGLEWCRGLPLLMIPNSNQVQSF